MAFFKRRSKTSSDLLSHSSKPSIDSRAGDRDSMAGFQVPKAFGGGARGDEDGAETAVYRNGDGDRYGDANGGGSRNRAPSGDYYDLTNPHIPHRQPARRPFSQQPGQPPRHSHSQSLSHSHSGGARYVPGGGTPHIGGQDSPINPQFPHSASAGALGSEGPGQQRQGLRGYEGMTEEKRTAYLQSGPRRVAFSCLDRSTSTAMGQWSAHSPSAHHDRTGSGPPTPPAGLDAGAAPSAPGRNSPSRLAPPTSQHPNGSGGRAPSPLGSGSQGHYQTSPYEPPPRPFNNPPASFLTRATSGGVGGEEGEGFATPMESPAQLDSGAGGRGSWEDPRARHQPQQSQSFSQGQDDETYPRHQGPRDGNNGNGTASPIDQTKGPELPYASRAEPARQAPSGNQRHFRSVSGGAAEEFGRDREGGHGREAQTVGHRPTQSQQVNRMSQSLPPSIAMVSNGSAKGKSAGSGGGGQQANHMHDLDRVVALLRSPKFYFEGFLLRKTLLDTSGHPPKPGDPAAEWSKFYMQLAGTTLSSWDAKEMERAAKVNETVPPTYTNVTDAVVSLPSPTAVEGFRGAGQEKMRSGPTPFLFVMTHAGSNKALFCCPDERSLVSWMAAIRLAAWERSRLFEIYTGTLLAMRTPGPGVQSPLAIPSSHHNGGGKVRNMEGWLKVRLPGDTEWRRLWCQLSDGGAIATAYELAHGGREEGVSNAGGENSIRSGKDEKRKSRRSSLFGFAGLNKFGKDKDDAASQDGHNGGLDRSQSVSLASGPPVARFYEKKGAKRPLASLTNVYYVAAIYPESKMMIDNSTLFKVEGTFLEGVDGGDGPFKRGREGFMLGMAEEGGSAKMIGWLLGFMDAFSLYGRPAGISYDPRDPHSPYHAYPIGPARDRLFIDRELTESLNVADDRAREIRRSHTAILVQRMRGGPTPPHSREPSGDSPDPSGQQQQQARNNRAPILPPIGETAHTPPESAEDGATNEGQGVAITTSDPPHHAGLHQPTASPGAQGQTPRAPAVPGSQDRNVQSNSQRQSMESNRQLQQRPGSSLSASAASPPPESLQKPSFLAASLPAGGIRTSNEVSRPGTGASSVEKPLPTPAPSTAVHAGQQQQVPQGSAAASLSSTQVSRQSSAQQQQSSPLVGGHHEPLPTAATTTATVDEKSQRPPSDDVYTMYSQYAKSMPDPEAPLAAPTQQQQPAAVPSSPPQQHQSPHPPRASERTLAGIDQPAAPKPPMQNRVPSGAAATDDFSDVLAAIEFANRSDSAEHVPTAAQPAAPTHADPYGSRSPPRAAQAGLTNSAAASPVQRQRQFTPEPAAVAPAASVKDNEEGEDIYSSDTIEPLRGPPAPSTGAAFGNAQPSFLSRPPPSKTPSIGSQSAASSARQSPANGAFPGSFAAGKRAAERVAAVQAAQAAEKAASNRPGRAGKGKARGPGWNSDSEEEEPEQVDEEDDEEDGPQVPRSSNMPRSDSGGIRSLPTPPAQASPQRGPQRDLGGSPHRPAQAPLPQAPLARGPAPVDDRAGQPGQFPKAASRRDIPAALRGEDAGEPGSVRPAYSAHGLLNRAMQEKQSRSLQQQDAHLHGEPLLQVGSKPPPPQTGLVGAIASHEKERKREGGMGAALTERERERKNTDREHRQREAMEEMQRQQMQNMGGGHPGMMGGWGGYPGMGMGGWPGMMYPPPMSMMGGMMGMPPPPQSQAGGAGGAGPGAASQQGGQGGQAGYEQMMMHQYQMQQQAMMAAQQAYMQAMSGFSQSGASAPTMAGMTGSPSMMSFGGHPMASMPHMSASQSAFFPPSQAPQHPHQHQPTPSPGAGPAGRPE